MDKTKELVVQLCDFMKCSKMNCDVPNLTPCQRSKFIQDIALNEKEKSLHFELAKNHILPAEKRKRRSFKTRMKKQSSTQVATETGRRIRHKTWKKHPCQSFIEAATEVIKGNKNTLSTSKKYGIPETTLRRYIKKSYEALDSKEWENSEKNNLSKQDPIPSIIAMINETNFFCETYHEKTMRKAIKEILKYNKGVKPTALKYGIPLITLRRCLNKSLETGELKQKLKEEINQMIKSFKSNSEELKKPMLSTRKSRRSTKPEINLSEDILENKVWQNESELESSDSENKISDDEEFLVSENSDLVSENSDVETVKKPKKYERNWKPYKKWKSLLKKAAAEIAERKIPVNTCAKKYGIPGTTLRRYLKKRQEQETELESSDSADESLTNVRNKKLNRKAVNEKKFAKNKISDDEEFMDSENSDDEEFMVNKNSDEETVKKPRIPYDELQSLLETAAAEIAENEIPVNTCAKKYGIPGTSLRRYLKKRQEQEEETVEEPKKFKRKPYRELQSLLKKAAAEIAESGIPVNTCAKKYGIPGTSLRRYLQKRQEQEEFLQESSENSDSSLSETVKKPRVSYDELQSLLETAAAEIAENDIPVHTCAKKYGIPGTSLRRYLKERQEQEEESSESSDSSLLLDNILSSVEKLTSIKSSPDQDMLIKAITEVIKYKNNVNYSAKKYGIPETTLRRYLKKSGAPTGKEFKHKKKPKKSVPPILTESDSVELECVPDIDSIVI